jgi:hypothetical protein
LEVSGTAVPRHGTEIVNQLRTAYECGAKFYVLFNYYDSNSGSYGTMKNEHFQALRSFWNEVVNDPKVIQGDLKADTAVVLPKNYAWGMRWAEDKIWGIFKADEQTKQLWAIVQTTLEEHGLKTDIIFSDPDFPLPTYYRNVYSLNQ